MSLAFLYAEALISAVSMAYCITVYVSSRFKRVTFRKGDQDMKRSQLQEILRRLEESYFQRSHAELRVAERGVKRILRAYACASTEERVEILRIIACLDQLIHEKQMEFATTISNNAKFDDGRRIDV